MERVRMSELYCLEIDLHNMSVLEARKQLKTSLSALPKHIKEVRVIHGYRGGKELQKLVRKDFCHKRIDRKIMELNQGMTTFMIK